jgi:F420-dependent oxidoreductase-like protein
LESETMRIGLQIPSFTWPGGAPELASRLAEIAQTADAAGFHSLWVMDHFFQLEPMLGKAEEPMMEGYSALTYLAAITEKVKLGTLVTGVIYRNPGFLTKQVTNLDVLSGGRAYFGIGAGWYEREATGLGFPFPPTAERFEMLEETLQIAHQMWSGETGPYAGKHFQMEEALCSPLPLTRPHPPIMIGGMGERKTLRFVAQYGDACNLFARAGDDVLRHKLEVLQRHCDDVGRDYDDIERTTLDTIHLVPGELGPREAIAKCRALADLGIQHAIFNMPNVHEIAPLEIFGKEIIPAVAGF